MRQLNSGCVQSQASDTHRKWVKVPLSWYKSFDPRPTHSVLNCIFSNNVVAFPLRSHFTNMKSMLLSLCVFAAVIVTARGFSREEPIDAVEEESPNELEAQLKNFEDSDDPKNSSNPHDCDCDGVCDALHYSRLPKPVRVSKITNRVLRYFTCFPRYKSNMNKYARICSTYKSIFKLKCWVEICGIKMSPFLVGFVVRFPKLKDNSD